MSVLTTWSARVHARLLSSRGQGTVEYVGIVLAVGVLLLALSSPMKDLAKPLAKAVGDAVHKAISTTVGGGS